MCHALIEDPKFCALLLRIDHDLADQVRADGCRCGGVLHRADYPRKPRGCPAQVRGNFSSRLSLCCSQCRRRSTSMSVRFLGQRAYLGLAVVLVSARTSGPTPAQARLSTQLGVARHTLQRWRAWWREQFPATPLWRAACVRFMPPVPEAQLPGELIERFTGAPDQALMRLLTWLSPVTIRSGRADSLELRDVR